MKPLSTDALFALVGLSLLVVGLALVYIPLAFVVPGGLFIAYAVLPDRGTP